MYTEFHVILRLVFILVINLVWSPQGKIELVLLVGS